MSTKYKQDLRTEIVGSVRNNIVETKNLFDEELSGEIVATLS